MTMSNYPSGFRGGVSLRGMPILNAYSGNVYWADSGSSLSGDGTFQRPFQSIEEAFASGRLTANNGDILNVKAGHTETVSAAGGIGFDVAGVLVNGWGVGSSRPTITFDTSTAADVDIDAANITLHNLLFVNGIDALVAPIDVNAADFSMLFCETRDNNSSYQVNDFIQTVAAADRLFIYGWVHRANGGKTGAQTAISIVGGNDHIIVPYSIDGDFATACIENVTTACDSLQIFGSAEFPAYLRTRNAADVIVTCVATTKGRVGPFINARLNDNAANITEAFVGADMEFFQPINIVNSDGESSMQTNITASTDA